MSFTFRYETSGNLAVTFGKVYQNFKNIFHEEFNRSKRGSKIGFLNGN